MFRRSISIALMASLAASGAQAAGLTNVQGTVTIDWGSGYMPALGGVVGAGARIYAGQGSAVVVYENGCTVKVAPGQTVAVLITAPNCHDAVAGSRTAAVAPECKKPTPPPRHCSP